MSRLPEKVEIVKGPFARANAQLGKARMTMSHSVHEARLGNYSKALIDTDKAIAEIAEYRQTLQELALI